MSKNLSKQALKIKIDQRSKYLRSLVVRSLIGGGRGHMGSAMSLIEILRVLYDDIICFKSNIPNYAKRDRVILSKGHGCLALYALLVDKKFIKSTELDKTSKFDSILGGHPEFLKVPGVEASTGALGHGFAMGVGMAIAAKLKKQKHNIYVIVGDGETNEGSVWEAALSASKHKLNNLKVILDYNKIQSYGFVSEVLNPEPLDSKWSSFGFAVKEINGHDINQIKDTLLNNIPLETDKPTALICHTVKGKGVSIIENQPSWHHKSSLSDEEIQILYDNI